MDSPPRRSSRRIAGLSSGIEFSKSALESEPIITPAAKGIKPASKKRFINTTANSAVATTTARTFDAPSQARQRWIPVLVLGAIISLSCVPSSTSNSIQAWLPDSAQFRRDLYPQPAYDLPDSLDTTVDRHQFDPMSVTLWASQNWHIALLLTVMYLVAIPAIRSMMETRDPIYASTVVTTWNVGLCVFSCTGLYHTAPALLQSIQTDGLEGSFCSPPWSYGFGQSGFWTACFIFSKPVEMIDTLWLLLRKREVIFLHWYHHATVALFCWHSYASRVGGAGLWFATMNYGVHSLMYAYFATQTQRPFPSLKKNVRLFTNPFLTAIQITQMVMGLIVLSVGSWRDIFGAGCDYLPKQTAILGVLMYSSYFALFVKLFVEHHILK